MGRSHTTLSRELKRNARLLAHSCYCNHYAQQKANERRQLPRYQKRYQHRPLQAYVSTKLKLGWLPEIIANRILHDHAHQPTMRISAETIYQWVYRDASRGGQHDNQLVRTHKNRKNSIIMGMIVV